MSYPALEQYLSWLVSDFQVLVAPGLHDSGPAHWQSRWQLRYPSFRRVVQRDWDTPDLPEWSARVTQAVRQADRPVLILAHSFGCLATVMSASQDAEKIAGALLVAPADPVKFNLVSGLAGKALPFPSIVIGSSNDPWMTDERAAYWATQWGSEFVNAGPQGHINAESDLGEWLFGLAQLQRLVALVNALINTNVAARCLRQIDESLTPQPEFPHASAAAPAVI